MRRVCAKVEVSTHAVPVHHGRFQAADERRFAAEQGVPVPEAAPGGAPTDPREPRPDKEQPADPALVDDAADAVAAEEAA